MPSIPLPLWTVTLVGTLNRSEGRHINEERIAQRTLELVRTESTTGKEQAAIDQVASWLESVADDIDVWTTPMSELEQDPAYPGREVERQGVPVVAAGIVGERPGPKIVLTGHVDTVPVGDETRWSSPSSGVRRGDIVYGRGAADMKAGLVAAVEAFSDFASRGRDFPGELRLVAVPGEEDGGTGTLAAIRRGWSGDYAIITEPTSGPSGPRIVVAHGGALTYTLVIEGRAAHAAVRREGVSALDQLITVYAALRQLEIDLNESETNPVMRSIGLPYPTTIGIVHGGTWASNVMESVTAEIRVGVRVGETISEAESRFETTLKEAIAGDPWLDAHPPRIERTGAAFGSCAIDPSHELVAALSEAAVSVTGSEPERVGVPYGCDMYLWTEVGGASTVVYGPGDVRHAHAVDEQVSLTETTTVTRVLLETISAIHQIPRDP